jgi:hypothetical protein
VNETTSLDADEYESLSEDLKRAGALTMFLDFGPDDLAEASSSVAPGEHRHPH